MKEGRRKSPNTDGMEGGQTCGQRAATWQGGKLGKEEGSSKLWGKAQIIKENMLSKERKLT